MYLVFSNASVHLILLGFHITQSPLKYQKVTLQYSWRPKIWFDTYQKLIKVDVQIKHQKRLVIHTRNCINYSLINPKTIKIIENCQKTWTKIHKKQLH